MSAKQHHQNKPGWSLGQRDPQFIKLMMPLWEWLYKNYFSVQTSGWETIPEGKVLFVGSHNGGLAAPDMLMTIYDWFRYVGFERPIYGLMHPNGWQFHPQISTMAAKTGAIIAHPKMAYAAFDSGASVLVYPGGAQDVFRLHSLRHQIYLAERKGFIKLALRQEVPIVPVISVGAHDTLFVLADIYKFIEQLHSWGMPWIFGLDPEVFPIYLGLPWGIAFGPLPNIPLPTTVHTRICPQITFDRYGVEAAKDKVYVDKCYEIVVGKMQHELDKLVEEAQF
jgi:1-acyl-sn-glycerol-3-phosphate acyltransferase